MAAVGLLALLLAISAPLCALREVPSLGMRAKVNNFRSRYSFVRILNENSLFARNWFKWPTERHAGVKAKIPRNEVGNDGPSLLEFLEAARRSSHFKDDKAVKVLSRYLKSAWGHALDLLCRFNGNERDENIAARARSELIQRQWEGALKSLMSLDTVRKMRPGIQLRRRGIGRARWELNQERWEEVLNILRSLDLGKLGKHYQDRQVTNDAISLKIRALGVGRQWPRAIQLFRSMRRISVDPNPSIYAAVMESLQLSRQWKKVLSVFDHMLLSGVRRDAVTYRIALAASQCELGGEIEVLKLAEEMRMLGKEYFGVEELLIANKARAILSRTSSRHQNQTENFIRQKDDQKIEIKGLQEMGSDERKSTAKYLWKIILSRGQHVAWMRLLSIWKQMQESGVPADAMSYHEIISILTNRGLWKQAIDLYGEMNRESIEALTETLPHVISSFSWLNKKERAMKILDEYQYRMGLTDRQAKIQNNIYQQVSIDRKGFSTTRSTSSITSSSVSRWLSDWKVVVSASQNWASAFKILASNSFSCEDEKQAFRSVLARECAIVREWKQALRLLKDMKPQGLWVYEEVMEGFKISRSLQGAMAVFSLAKKASYPMRIETYNILLKACERARQWEAGLVVLNQMDKEGVRRDSTTFSTAMKSLSRSQHWQRALSLFSELGGLSVRRDQLIYSAAMEACRRGNSQTQEWVRDQMHNDLDGEEEDGMKFS
eukprot:CAMPEP_0167740382 /NCGR_PEP_ID=MMETSP0110_2-20121227/247_1 /TAXON_ID=629695 /ORGANISM="Gymnochlora sp., Strain CCMP2014" /LENGTH=719 /DNA_ID=CAMNT_0007624271 /DNA_START=1240 /DNA_END=3399 /DNA_ORIENTATION=-